MLRTKGEQKAFLDGFESCAESVEKYLSAEGKKQLECLLSAVRNAVEIEDIGSDEVRPVDSKTYGYCCYHEIECDYSGLCRDCPHNTEEDTEWFIQDEERAGNEGTE